MSIEAIGIILTALSFIGTMGYIVWFCWGDDDE